MSYCKSCGVECTGRLKVHITAKRCIDVCEYCFRLPIKELKRKVKK